MADIVEQYESGSDEERMVGIYEHIKKNMKWNGQKNKYSRTGIAKVLKEESGNSGDINLELGQWDAYDLPQDISAEESLTRLLNHMQGKDLFTKTQLMIGPGYSFRMIDTIVTNFHQPKSTLLLLVAAATKGKWNQLYDYALANNFRFLSYGDSSIIHI